MSRCTWLIALALMLCLPAVSLGDSINLGLLSFDNLIPAGASPGVNVFNVSNFTGDPALGLFALPPAFPIYDSVTLLSGTLTLIDDIGNTLVILLGDIGPGGLADTTPVQFSETFLFSSATFMATLSQTSFSLFDGSTFTAESAAVVVDLLPSSPPFLTPGGDLSVIAVSGTLFAAVPEPGTTLVLCTGLAMLIGLKRKIRH